METHYPQTSQIFTLYIPKPWANTYSQKSRATVPTSAIKIVLGHIKPPHLHQLIAKLLDNTQLDMTIGTESCEAREMRPVSVIIASD